MLQGNTNTHIQAQFWHPLKNKEKAMDYFEYIKRKYDYLNNEDITILVDSAKEILFNLLYPCGASIDFDKFAVPKQHKTWVLRAVIEMIERAGISSATAYRENGLDFTFDRSQLSYGLISEITPKVGSI